MGHYFPNPHKYFKFKVIFIFVYTPGIFIITFMTIGVFFNTPSIRTIIVVNFKHIGLLKVLQLRVTLRVCLNKLRQTKAAVKQ